MAFSDSLANGLRAAWCGVLQTTNAFTTYWNEGVPSSLLTVDESVGRALYAATCNRDAPRTIAPQNQGQCPGVNYRIVHTYRVRVPPATAFTNVTFTRNCPTNFYGAISYPEIRNVGGSRGLFVDCRDSGGVSTPNQTVVNSTSTNLSAEYETINWSVSRCDGQPDNCGTGVIVPPPSGYNTTTVNITYTDSSNTSITIPTTFTFDAPLVNINNDIIVPVRIVYVDATLSVPVTVNARFNLSTGDITFSFGSDTGVDPRSDPPENPTDIDSDDPPPPPPPDSESPDDPPPDNPDEETIIRGALVSVQTIPNSVSVLLGTGGAPDLLIPDVGVLWFKLRGSGSSVGWSQAIRIQAARQIIECPWSWGAIAVVASMREGAVATVTPLRTKGDVARPF